MMVSLVMGVSGGEVVRRVAWQSLFSPDKISCLIVKVENNRAVHYYAVFSKYHEIIQCIHRQEASRDPGGLWLRGGR